MAGSLLALLAEPAWRSPDAPRRLLPRTVCDTCRPRGAAPAELDSSRADKRSVTDDYIVCLEDGKKLKMLKRHLMTAYGMTPEAYRAKWGLKPDYPMVAPNYAATRKELAMKIGLDEAAGRGARACAKACRSQAAGEEGRGVSPLGSS